ncbi:hypothetical protein GCM10022221_33600 [Actinocorallia aurea]
MVRSSRFSAKAAAVCAAAVSALVLPLLAAPVAAAPVAPVNGGVYTLVPGASGKCVEVVGSAKAKGAVLAQAACAAGAARQQWRAVAASGRFQLVNVNSGLCLDVPGYSAVSGVPLLQWDCGANKANQLWSFTASSAAKGKYRVSALSSGQCLSTKDGSTAGGNPIVQERCSDIARMQIAFNAVGATPPPTTTQPPSTAKPVVAADGTGKYRTVQAAIDAVPANNKARTVITVKAGTYRERVTVPANKPYITLQGLGSGPSKTVIVNNRTAADGSANNGATAAVFGHDFTATNLTISNDYGVGVQTLALNLNVDRGTFRNVRLLSNQDTLLVNDSARVYFVGSYIEGTVDFIYGGGIAVFHSSTIHEKRTTGGPITAASTPAGRKYGFLIYKSTVTGATAGTTTLGRPWRQNAQVLYRESNLTNTIRGSQPWIDMSSASWKKARFLEYRNTGAGAGTNGNRPQLAASKAGEYTPQKYLAGSDGWNPVG